MTNLAQLTHYHSFFEVSLRCGTHSTVPYAGRSVSAACYSSPSSCKKNKMCQHFILGHCRVPKTLTFTSQLAVSLYTCWQNSNETYSTLPLSRCPSVPMNHTSLPATTPQNHTLHITTTTTTPSLSTPSLPLLHPHYPRLYNTPYLSAWLFFLDH